MFNYFNILDNVRPLVVFQEKAIYSQVDQELLMNLWNNSYNSTQKGLRRGEILFYFWYSICIIIVNQYKLANHS
jgi:hypothetical protein